MTGAPTGADIFAAQPGDPDLLAAIYDLEHDEQTDDLAFYRQLAKRHAGPALDMGCGSGRLFRALLEGGASPLLGVDGSPALLRRAESRVARDPLLAAARAEGRLSLRLGDVRRAVPGEPRTLTVAVGVLPHLDGPDGAHRMLAAVASKLAPEGRLVIDDIGPQGLPWRDLPLSLDWTRELDGAPVVRRSQLTRHETPEGLRVEYLTLTDTVRPGGTIARLPASFRLWYPSMVVLEELLETAGLTVELTYGSHDLDPLNQESERRIVIARRGRSGAGERAPGRHRRRGRVSGGRTDSAAGR